MPYLDIFSGYVLNNKAEFISKISKNILKYPFIAHISFHILFISFDILGGELPDDTQIQDELAPSARCTEPRLKLKLYMGRPSMAAYAVFMFSPQSC
jgi:hypothetical protein